MSGEQQATLVVIEFGASWPKWLEPSCSGHLVVVAQHYEGEPGSLIRQVASRLTRLQAGHWKIGSMVLVANDRVDPEAFAARSVLARGLMARLRQMGGGDLVLTVDDGAGARVCQALTGLASAVDRDAVGSAVGINVRLGRQPPIAGLSSNWALLHACAETA